MVAGGGMLQCLAIGIGGDIDLSALNLECERAFPTRQKCWVTPQQMPRQLVAQQHSLLPRSSEGDILNGRRNWCSSPEMLRGRVQYMVCTYAGSQLGAKSAL